jgi:hypothetical protein
MNAETFSRFFTLWETKRLYVTDTASDQIQIVSRNGQLMDTCYGFGGPVDWMGRCTGLSGGFLDCLKCAYSASRPKRSMVSSVSRTSSQVVEWLMTHIRSTNFRRSRVDDMNARSSQNTRARTFLLIW